MKPTDRLTLWKHCHNSALGHLRRTHEAIERLATLAPDNTTDEKICFAGNVLRGSEALLREADAAFHRRAG